MKKLNAQELRNLTDDEVKKISIKRYPIYFILDNVYDTYNIGGIFRLADALTVEKMYLCGITDTPPNPKIKKASIGTYKIVPWEYKKTTLEAIKELKKNIKNIKVVAVEQSSTSKPFNTIEYSTPTALIFGNETSGVSQGVLKKCDYIAEIPMFGINKSLNVIISAAIVSYFVRLKTKIASQEK